MSEELRKLLNQINGKKDEVRKLVNEGKIEEAKNAKNELIALQDKFNILMDLDDETKEEVEDKARKNRAQTAGAPKTEAKAQIRAFVNAIKAAKKRKQVSDEDAEILNSMSEGIDEDGGLTVPPDVKTEIKELRRGVGALEDLVNVEHVTTLSGSRVIETEADQTPFDNVEEEAEFPEVGTPKFEQIKYKVKKKGGILKVTAELISDTAENIMAYLKKWIAKKAKATRNFLIINKIKEICAGLEVPVTGIDSLKDIFNVYLDPDIAVGSIVVTNQNGFNYLDKLKDEDGKYIMQKDPTQPTARLLFGIYPVKVFKNKVLKDINGKAPIICGDLKEAITIFDRESLTIDTTDLAAGAWEKDLTSIKVRERLDIQAVDKGAVYLGLVSSSTVTTDINGDGVYNEQELNKLTKEDILALAEEKGYDMETTAESKKADIIAEFIAQQETKQG